MKHIFFVAWGWLLLVPGVALAAQANDPYSHLQWYEQQVQVQRAWDQTTGSASVVVAVIDSGVDITHPDLRDNIYTNLKEVPDDGVDNDGNGYVDDVHGWDFYAQDKDARPDVPPVLTDGVHHGTAIAGIIGAVGNNGQGITGVNWHVRIMPLRVLNAEGDGTLSAIVEAVDYAVAQKVDVINLSFVGSFSAASLDAALQRAYDAGVVIVAAAGNGTSGSNLNLDPLYPVCSVGTRNQNVVIGVAATTRADERAPFSNFGSDCIDLSAPGVGMLTTQVPVRDLGAYGDRWQGTSFSAPLVAGAAALIRSLYPQSTPDEVRTILQLSVDPVRGRAPDGTRSALGTGRLNIARGLEVAETLLGAPAPKTTLTPGSVHTQATTSKPLAVAAGVGDAPLVRVFQGDGEAVSWLAYGEAFRGGVQISVGQVDAAQGWDIVTVPGKTGGPHVRVFSDRGGVTHEFFAYDPSVTSGLDVALADLDSDGVEEIVVLPSDPRLPLRVFHADGTLVKEIAVDRSADARLALTDVTGDGEVDLVVASGSGTAPLVQIVQQSGAVWNQFYVYAPTLHTGIVADVVGAGAKAIFASGTRAGAGPQVRLFTRSGALVTQFFAFDQANRDGVDVAFWPSEGSEEPLLVTSGMVNGTPELRVYTQQGQRVSRELPLSGFTKRVTISGE